MMLPGLYMPLGMMAKGGRKYASYLVPDSSSRLQRIFSPVDQTVTQYTLSAWVKASSGVTVFESYASEKEQEYLSYYPLYDYIESGYWKDTEVWYEELDNTGIASSQWHHMVMRYDSTLSASSRVRIYVNGSLKSAKSEVVPSSNYSSRIWYNGRSWRIGSNGTGRFAFVNLVQGLSLDPSSFGESVGGIWTRKPYVGSYGSYGFCLDGSASGPGQDVSGNGQDFSVIGTVTLDSDDLPPWRD